MSNHWTPSDESLFPPLTPAGAPVQGWWGWLGGWAGASQGAPPPVSLDLPTEEIDVDVESTDYLTGDLDWSSSSVSDSDERGSMQSLGSDEGYSSSSMKRIKLQDNHKTCLGL